MATNSRQTVHELCVALNAGELDEDRFIAALVALPIVTQAPLPDGVYVHGLIANQGPIFYLNHEAFRGAISPELASRALKAMIAGGHAA